MVAPVADEDEPAGGMEPHLGYGGPAGDVLRHCAHHLADELSCYLFYSNFNRFDLGINLGHHVFDVKIVALL